MENFSPFICKQLGLLNLCLNRVHKGILLTAVALETLGRTVLKLKWELTQ